LRRTVIESVDAMLADARHREVDPETDGLQALNAQLQHRQWAWIDLPVPALNGQTPRQAATTPQGRQRLEALLEDFEWRGDRSVSRVRTALKL
jgi:hypothetical protein